MVACVMAGALANLAEAGDERTIGGKV